jgi:hypothetical protein
MTPLGVPEATPHRGTLMGNRGCLVDARGALARPWQVERWITCVLAFRGRRRHPLMQPGRLTELFFLDEATALAAGHRPCAECRRADLTAFRAAWALVHPADAEAGLPGLDRRLHRERTAAHRRRAPAAGLPDGAMVLLDARPWLVQGGALRAWSHAGYGERRAAPAQPVPVLTAPSLVATLAAGWRPAPHPSAAA